MKIILLGPPGSGKGTQGQMICDTFKLVHISTGDILRQAIKEKSALGLEAKKYMEKGQLVSDDLINQVIIGRLGQSDCAINFLLDGFPRTIEQAEFLKNQEVAIDQVILIDVPDKALVQRIVGRRVHPASGRIYHTQFNPPKVAGIDDITKEQLVHRSDDYEETVLLRLLAYHSQTSPLIEFYRNQEKLISIDGNRSPQVIFNDIKGALS